MAYALARAVAPSMPDTTTIMTSAFGMGTQHYTGGGRGVISIQRGITPLRRRHDHRARFFHSHGALPPRAGGGYIRAQRAKGVFQFRRFRIYSPAPQCTITRLGAPRDDLVDWLAWEEEKRDYRSLGFGFSSYRTRHIYGGFLRVLLTLVVMYSTDGAAGSTVMALGQTLPFRNFQLWWAGGLGAWWGYLLSWSGGAFSLLLPVVSFFPIFSRIAS
jgi:hypothetical protein